MNNGHIDVTCMYMNVVREEMYTPVKLRNSECRR